MSGKALEREDVQELLKRLAEIMDLGGRMEREMSRASRLDRFVGPGNLIDTAQEA